MESSIRKPSVTLQKRRNIKSRSFSKVFTSCNFIPDGLKSPAAGTAILAVTVVIFCTFSTTEGYNDEKGILKWNPYWFTNFRYSNPSSFYISPSRIGTPYKRLSDRMWNSGSPSSFAGENSGGAGGIYKWSPVYFSGSAAPTQSSAYYGGVGGTGNGYMYSSNRPRWSLSDYGGSRYLTRYYGGNSYSPRVTKDSAGIDLTGGNNDLSALLGDEMVDNGLGLDNEAVGIFDGDEDKKNR